MISNIDITNKNVCYDIIYNKLLENVNEFKKSLKISFSYPIKEKYHKLIKSYPKVITSTFTGNTLDIISGLLYINEIHYETLVSSLKLIDIDNIVACNNVCEVRGYEILWRNYQLILPSNKKTDLLKELSYMYNNSGKRFFCIPIGIELVVDNKFYAHSNVLIFDFKTRQVERFEPHGSEPPYGLDYDSRLLDNLLENKLLDNNLHFKYIKPVDYLPKIGFQIKEIYELDSNYIGDPNGFCAAWCIWWLDMRISNPDIPRDKLVKLLTKEIINNEYSYKNLIRNYAAYITEYRDKILSEVRININDWLNDNLTDDNIKSLNNELRKYIIDYI